MKKQRKQKKDQFLGASTKSKRKKIRGGYEYVDSLDDIEIRMFYWDGEQNKQKTLDKFNWADPNDIQDSISKGPPQ